MKSSENPCSVYTIWQCDCRSYSKFMLKALKAKNNNSSICPSCGKTLWCTNIPYDGKHAFEALVTEINEQNEILENLKTRKLDLRVIDVIESFELDYQLGNAVKFIIGSVQESEKMKKNEFLKRAIWYLNRKLRENNSSSQKNDFD